MWPIKAKGNRQLLTKWPNLIPYSKLQECIVTVLLLTSIPLARQRTWKALTGAEVALPFIDH